MFRGQATRAEGARLTYSSTESTNRGHKADRPVLDRGPYVNGRRVDLTNAAKKALAFPALDTTWSTR